MSAKQIALEHAPNATQGPRLRSGGERGKKEGGLKRGFWGTNKQVRLERDIRLKKNCKEN